MNEIEIEIEDEDEAIEPSREQERMRGRTLPLNSGNEKPFPAQ
jgi:hypothetical protein